MSEKGYFNGIGFKTEGVWLASDIAIFFESISKIYDAFLAAKIWSGLIKEIAPTPQLSEERLEELKRLREAVRNLSKKIGISTSDFPVPRILKEKLPESDIYEKFINEYSLKYIYLNIKIFASPDQLLYVKGINIHSPGGMIFGGIAEIIEQVRKFIKACLFGYRQEKVLGDLKIAEKFLEIEKKYKELQANNPDKDPEKLSDSGDIAFIAGELKEKISKINNLEKQGKLLDILKNLDYDPTDPD